MDGSDRPAAVVCAHCGETVAAGSPFCCAGCAAAFDTIQKLGLGRYYERRVLDPAARAPKPESTAQRHIDRFVTTSAEEVNEVNLMVDGLHCGACVWLIEAILARNPSILDGRVNLTTRRMKLRWRGGAAVADDVIGEIEALGYAIVPYDPSCLKAADDLTGRMLMRCLAVAGFAAGNVMMISIAIWSGMSAETRALLHAVSAAIALPAILYAGRPFFGSAWAALRHGRTNMDVPVSIGVILVTGMSCFETLRGGPDTYFEASTALLFFLLVGRVLDHQARGRVRATAEQLLVLRATEVTIIDAEGMTRRVPQDELRPGMRILVGMGERIGADGRVMAGRSSVDTGLVTGESVPLSAEPGVTVFAGTVNLGSALTIEVEAAGDRTLLAECVRLIAAAEERKGRFVALADRVARRYAPVIHLTAISTFVLWYFWLHAPWTRALLNASAVLIVTCPCALALAVPAVQVLATARLFRAGILLKSPTALERLADVTVAVFDKTGTLTEPTLALSATGDVPPEDLALAASLAACSHHPLARALLRSAPAVTASTGAVEYPGEGVSLAAPEGDIRLGSRRFCGIADMSPAQGPEIWLMRPGASPRLFEFEERLRPEAFEAIAGLRALGLKIVLLSGDRAAPVERIARQLGIKHWMAAASPIDKVNRLRELAHDGRLTLMVGDGLNDGPALAAAGVSMSPASAVDISQNTADLVYQGRTLTPVLDTLTLARRARQLTVQNLSLSIGYNLLAVPLAICGYVTPWVAAAAMSSSSLLVIGNSFRLGRVRRG